MSYEKWLEQQEVVKRNRLVHRFSSKRFGYVMVVASLMGIQNFICAFYHQQNIRKRVFSEKWCEENLKAFHKSYMGDDAP